MRSSRPRLAARARFGAGLLSLLALAWSPPAGAQGLMRVTEGGGEVGFEVRGAATRSGPGPVGRDAQRQGWLGIPLSGAVGDPRFFSYSVVLRPTWSRAISRTGTFTVVDSRLLARDFSTQLSPVSWLSLNLTQSRSTGNSSGRGTASETHLSTLNTGIQLRTTPFRLAATVSERGGVESWEDLRSDLASRRDFADRVVRISGQSSKTSVLLERTSHDDHIGREDFAGRVGALTHTLAWGKGSSLGSSLELSDRVGGTPWSQSSWSEQARLQHTRTFQSDWQYRRFRSRAEGTGGSNDALGVGVSHQALAWLRWGLHGAMRSTATSELRTSGWSAVPDLWLVPPVPSPFRLAAEGRVGVEHERWQGDDATEIPVLNERHTVGASRAFVLDDPDVDPATVVIRDAGQSLVYALATDYELVPVGAFLQVRVPVTSRIRVGDLVLTSYRFRLASRRAADVVVADWSATLSLPSATLRHRQTTRTRQTDGGAAALALPDFDEVVTELDVTRGTRAGRLRADAARRSRTVETGGFRSFETGATWAPPPVRALQGTLSARWSRTRGDGHRLSTLSGTASLAWDMAESAQVGGQLEGFRTRREGGRLERSLSADLQARWRCGGLDLQPTYSIQWRDAGSRLTLGRWSLRATRRF